MGTLKVVGIGPGCEDKLTIEAKRALDEADVIVGYKAYVELVKHMSGMSEKAFLQTAMRGEVERCKMALDEANKGQDVCMVCSGDAGIYGMAGIVLQLAKDYEDVEVRVIPGVTAALSGSALLGAAVGHDVALISLSDLLTDWSVIEKRLRGAAMADFVMVLYNPASHKRSDYCKKACEIILEYKSEDTVCGIAKNIGRDGEYYSILTLKELKELENNEVDMFSTVFIGNSSTEIIGKHMVTPRGYKIEK